MGVLRTALKKVKASIDESEDHLKESWMREEDRGNSDSSEEQDVVVEGAQESGPTGVEVMVPPIPPATVQAAEPSMDVDMEDILPLTSEEATAVTAEEDEVLMGDPTSVAGEMARLQVTSPDSQKPEDRETSQ